MSKSLAIVLFAFWLQVNCYNVEVNENYTRIIQPPTEIKATVIPTTKFTTTTAISATAHGSTQNSGFSEQEPNPPPFEYNPFPAGPHPIPVKEIGFFGYDLRVYSSNAGARLLVGAPKRRYYDLESENASKAFQDATGNILLCSFQNLFNESHSLCHSVTPEEAEPGDSFGMSLAASSDHNIRACSLTRKRDCTVAFFTPGFCFQRIESQMWIQDSLSLESECPLSTTLDLIFLLDGSDSVGEENFAIVKNWVLQVAKSFDIKDGSTRIGVIQYSHFYPNVALERQPFITTEVRLGQYTDQTQLSEAVENIVLSGYTTYTAHALNKSINDFMSSDRFTSTAKVLILLTDGMSSDSDKLVASASHVRSLGINTIAVGVGNARLSELRTIATGTSTDRNIFYVSRFEQLGELVNTLKANILTFVLEGTQRASGEVANLLQYAQVGFSIATSPDGKEKQSGVSLGCCWKNLIKSNK